MAAGQHTARPKFSETYPMTSAELAHYIFEYDIAINNPGQASPICSERLLAAAIEENTNEHTPPLELAWVRAVFEPGYDPDNCPLHEYYPFLVAVWNTSYA